MEEKSRAGKGDTAAGSWEQAGQVRVQEALCPSDRLAVVTGEWRIFQGEGRDSVRVTEVCRVARGGCSGPTIGSPHGLGHLGVQALVRNEVCTLLETLVTFATAERPLACVHTPVV